MTLEEAKVAEYFYEIAEESDDVIAQTCDFFGIVEENLQEILREYDMLRTARELRANANGDCNAIMQAIYWEERARSQ